MTGLLKRRPFTLHEKTAEAPFHTTLRGRKGGEDPLAPPLKYWGKILSWKVWGKTAAEDPRKRNVKSQVLGSLTRKAVNTLPDQKACQLSPNVQNLPRAARNAAGGAEATRSLAAQPQPSPPAEPPRSRRPPLWTVFPALQRQSLHELSG